VVDRPGEGAVEDTGEEVAMPTRTRRPVPPRVGTWVRTTVARRRRYRPYDVPDDGTYDAGTGPWDGLRALPELGHYALIAGYLRRLAPELGPRPGPVLDVGCGEGLLLEHLGRDWRYRGIDLSDAAVERAREAVGPGQQVDVADAATHRPSGPLAAVVFNECLYYLDDPLGAVERCCEPLVDGGLAVVSMYDAPVTRRVWATLDRWAAPVDRVELRHTGGTSWHVAAYRTG